MPIVILSVLIQVAFLVHILKTRRNTMWIWIVLGIPVAGSIAYFIVEILPGFMNSHKGQKAQRDIVKILNPEKDFNEAMENYTITDTVKNTQSLADECMNKQMYKEAQQLYMKALQGEYRYDPTMLLGLAQAEFELENFDITKSTLNTLMDKNPDFENPDAHLLYAKSLEGLNENQSAIEVYEALESYDSNPEILYRHAMLLKGLGKTEEAHNLLQQILRIANISGKHHKTLFKQWIKMAKQELNK